MKNKNFILNELNIIAQKSEPELQIKSLKYLIYKYASIFKNELKGLNESNVNNQIHELYFIISKY